MYKNLDDFACFLSSKLTREKRLVFFVGAGISKPQPSNLPLGKELVNHVLDCFSDSEDEKQILLREAENLRPEALLQIIGEEVGEQVFDVWNILKKGKPNVIHHFLAKALSKDWIEAILTTNFDCLLEEAAKEKSPNIVQIASGIQFRECKKYKGHLIFKLHGSIEDPNGQETKDTIQSALSEVSFGLIDPKKQIIMHYLNAHATFFLGYSGLDNFDIYPALGEIKNEHIFWISHTENLSMFKTYKSMNVEKAKINDNLKEIIKKTNGTLIVCNTRKLIERTWEKAFHKKPPDLGTTEIDYKACFENWSKSVNLSDFKNIVLGIIFRKFTRNLDKAFIHFERGLAVAGETKNKKRIADAINYLGLVWSDKKDYGMAIKHHAWSSQLAREIKYETGYAYALGNLGNIYLKQDMLDNALSIFLEIRDILTKIDNKRGRMRVLHDIGRIYSKKGDVKEAFRYYEESLECEQSLRRGGGADPEAKALCLGSMGDLYYEQKQYQEAIKLYKSSLEFFTNIGYPHEQAILLGKVANAHFKLEQYDEAEKYYEKCESRAKQIKDEEIKQALLDVNKRNKAQLQKHLKKSNYSRRKN